MLRKGEDEEEAGEGGKEEEKILFGIVERGRVDRLEPGRYDALDPPENPSPGLPEKTVDGRHAKPELPLRDRGREEELPAPHRGDALVESEDPLQVRRPAPRQAYDEDGSLHDHRAVAAKEEFVE